MSADLVTLGAAKLAETTGALQFQALLPLAEGKDDDVETIGELEVISSLGLSAMPYQADDSGHAEGIVLRDVGGLTGCIIGARDTRSARIVGNLKPGDTVLHSTGPNNAAQVQLKEEKRQAVLTAKTESEDDLVIFCDGKNKQIQLVTPWGRVEISEDNGVVLASDTGEARIQLKGNQVIITGSIVLGGATPTGFVLYSVAPIPLTGSAGGPGVPAPGVYIGV